MRRERRLPFRLKVVLFTAVLAVVLSTAFSALSIRHIGAILEPLLLESGEREVKLLADRTQAKVEAVLQAVRSQQQSRTDRGLSGDSILVSFANFSSKGDLSRWSAQVDLKNYEKVSALGIKDNQWDDIRGEAQRSFVRAVAQGPLVINIAAKYELPLLTLLIPQEAGSVVEVEFSIEDLLVSLLSMGPTQVFVVDGQGNTVLHPDIVAMRERKSYADLPVVTAQLNGKGGAGPERFRWRGKKWLGQSLPIGGAKGMAVFLTDEDAALGPISKLLKATLFLGAFLATFLFFGAIWASGSRGER